VETAKLFLYSLAVSAHQWQVLEHMVGKPAAQITVAVIENAADVLSNSHEWLGGFREMLRSRGYQLELVDLRTWIRDTVGLHALLLSKDVIWVGGGHTYYLRWILQEAGADQIIHQLVAKGKVYAGWSAGAVVAGPTTEFFDLMGDDPAQAPRMILQGLNLTDVVVVSHVDHADFAIDASRTNQHLTTAGFRTTPLKDDEVLVVNGIEKTVL